MVTTSAAKGLMEILQTNLGPRGTLKMYVRAVWVSHELIQEIADPLYVF